MVLLLPIVVTAVLLFGGGAVWYFRRQCPMLTDDDLPRNIRGATSAEDDPVALHVVSKLTPNEREAFYKAFHNGPDFRWVANADGNKKFDDKDAEDKRWKLTQYMVEFVVGFVERYGHIVVARSKQGHFLGAVCLLPPYKSHRQFMAHFMTTAVSLGKPPTSVMGEEVVARFKAFGVTVEEHHKVMKDCKPHWYVANLAVAERAQGKGVGRILNHVAIAMANGEPLYLECHDKNVAFYSKMGYDVQKQFILMPETETPVSFPMNAMTHGYHPK
jgi:ribosomal protein S18 acetylase RimI-like enzyme